MKPLVDDFLTEHKGAASPDLNAVLRKCDPVREDVAAFIRISSNHGQQMFPKQCDRVHRVIPIRFREFMAPETFRNWAKSSCCCWFSWWTAEMPACRPKEIINSLRSETELPKREFWVSFGSRQVDFQICCHPRPFICIQADFLVHIGRRLKELLSDNPFLPISAN